MKWAILLTLLSGVLQAAPADITLKFGVVDIKPVGCQPIAGEPLCIQNYLISELETSTSLNFETIIVSYPRMLRSLTDGRIDLVFLVSESHLFKYAEPIAKASDIHFVLVTKNKRLLKERVNNKRVAWLRGATHDYFARSLDELIEVHVDNLENAIKLLITDRVDAVIGPKIVVNDLLNTHQIDSATIFQPVEPEPREVFLFCRKGACSDSIKQRLVLGMQTIQPEQVRQLQN